MSTTPRSGKTPALTHAFIAYPKPHVHYGSCVRCGRPPQDPRHA